MDVVGIDNDMRREFFGAEASTALEPSRGSSRSSARPTATTRSTSGTATGSTGSSATYGDAVELVIHTAAQPSHDWAAKRAADRLRHQRGRHAERARGDPRPRPRGGVHLHLDQQGLRRPPELAAAGRAGDPVGDRPRAHLRERHPRGHVDRSSLHSLFGASKVAADVMVQEYGRYFGMRTACFRGGTLTGPRHSATELHGFLAYLMRCAMTGTPYTVFGYKGKQVRDAIHSLDLIRAFDAFFRAPRVAEVYNIGGGRLSNCSVLEAIRLCEEIAGPQDRVDLRRRESGRRPHLVDRRQRRVPGALSGLEARVRRPADPRGDPRPRTRTAGAATLRGWPRSPRPSGRRSARRRPQ